MISTFRKITGRVYFYICESFRNKQYLVLFIIILLGSYFRFYNIDHLFNTLHDADEGVYAIGARFISQGYIPYKDFILVHPPLYELVLAGIYKLFGYSFFYGRYLSAVLSLGSIILAYLIGKKAYHPSAGIVAALIFAVSPEMVFWGRSNTLESLGIFFILLAIYQVVCYFKQKNTFRLLTAGLFMGLAIATKYLFIPAVIAIAGAVVLLNTWKYFWRAITFLGKIRFWLIYVSFMAVILALLVLVKCSLNLNITIPFIDQTEWSSINFVLYIVVLVIPLILTLLLAFTRMRTKELWRIFIHFKNIKSSGVLILGILIGFFSVTGYFWLTMPKSFFDQTFIMQLNQPGDSFPSFISFLLRAISPSGVFGISYYFILLIIPVLFFMLNRQSFQRVDSLFLVSMILVVIICQWFPSCPRYYISLYTFFFLAVASLMPVLDMNIFRSKLYTISLDIRQKMIIIFGIIIFLFSISIVVIIKYPVYDVQMPLYSSNEYKIYTDTIEYLKDAGAKKICSPNQIIPALSLDFATDLNVDYYAARLFNRESPEKIIQQEIDNGVDFVILDYWSNYWQDEWTAEFKEAVVKNAKLVAIIDPSSQVSTQIYWLKAPETGVINGQFKNWASNGDYKIPFGWLPMIISGGGGQANLEQTSYEGQKCALLKVYQNVVSDKEPAYSSTVLLQYVPFPEHNITLRALPVQNTVFDGTDITGPHVKFQDSEGHSIVLGFSDRIDTDEITLSMDGKQITITKKSNHSQWEDYFIDIVDLFDYAGWSKTKSIGINISNVVSSTEGGDFLFYISEISSN